MVAVRVHPAMSADKEARGRLLLGIQARHLHAVPGHKRQKGDEVPLVHGVVKRDIPFHFDLFGVDGVRLVRLLRLQRRQGHAAAGIRAFAHRPDHVAAHRADVEKAARQVPGPVAVLRAIPGKQLGYRHAQRPGQRLQQRDVGQTPAGFPLGDGFVAYIQPLRQIALGQSPLLAQAADDFPGYIALHAIPPCPRAYHARRKDATYAS